MLYLFPTSLEAELFMRLCPDAQVVISGVGMAATAATLASLHTSGGLDGECVVLAGIAGAYGDSVSRGEVVEVVSETTIELPQRFRQCYRNEPFTELRRVHSNSVHRTVVDAEGADVENMEGASLFALCSTMGVRCVEIRAVSNRVGEEFSLWCVDEALENLALTLKHLFVDK